MNRIGLIFSVALLISFGAVFAVLRDASLPDPSLAAVTGTLTATTGPTRAPTNTPKPTLVPTNTPIATFTPSKTLLPPPTFEPSTSTPPPSLIPSLTPTFTPIAASVPGLIGLETVTPVGTAGCVPRKDWKLTYTVQANDALVTIANLYGTYASDLAQGNCLADPNKIVVGQVLNVPGTVPLTTPQWDCSIQIQLLTPLNYAEQILGTGSLVFHWYGPRTPRNLIRLFAPNGTKTEYVVDLKQDYTLDLVQIGQAGQYTWYIYPLDINYNGVCTGAGPFYFSKALSPTFTPTPTPHP